MTTPSAATFDEPAKPREGALPSAAAGTDQEQQGSETGPDVQKQNSSGKVRRARSTGRSSRASDALWQWVLLPVMALLVLYVTYFFLRVSHEQVTDLHERIFSTAPAPLLGSIDFDVWENAQNIPTSDALAAAQFKIAAALESYAMARRYHQANILLMSRIWLHYLGFVTGMILALVGAIFILGKVREDETEFEAVTATWSGSLRSSSPGLILAVMGVALLLATIWIHHDIQVTDQPLFATADPGSTTIQEITPPLPDFIPAQPEPETNKEDQSGDTQP